MRALGKTYAELDMLDFDKRIKKLIGEHFEYICELKFDGVAIGLTCRDGKLAQAVTRGDGTRGDDATTNIKTSKNITNSLEAKGVHAAFADRGKILMHRKDFTSLNAERRDQGTVTYAN